MKYVAIRAAEHLRGEYVVMGQRNTDYNWDILNRCESKESAEGLANNVALNLSRAYRAALPCYGCNGYGKTYYNGSILMLRGDF